MARTATRMSALWSVKRRASDFIFVPPTQCWTLYGLPFRSVVASVSIWRASSRVGDRTRTEIDLASGRAFNLTSRSMAGNMNAMVFPVPVLARASLGGHL